MNFTVVVFTLLGITAAFSFPALLHARKTRTLSFSDCALPIVPAASFLIGMEIFNSAAQVGYAFLVYPPLVIVLSLSLLYARVYFLGGVKASPRKLSFCILVAACTAAFLLGVAVPPWYE